MQKTEPQDEDPDLPPHVRGAQTLDLEKPIEGKELGIFLRFIRGCVQVPVVVNVSSTSARTHPQLQTKQLELLSVASYTSLHPHGKEEKKKKHAGNPAFVFVHRADKMSCHPFSQQEKVRTDQMKALIGLAVGVVRWDSEHCVSAGEHCLPEERKRCLTSGTFTRVKDRPFTQHCSARENSLIYFKCHPKRKATKVRTVKARCYPEVLSAFIFYLVVISRFSDQESELPFRATTIKYSVCHAPCTQRDVSLHCQQHVKHNQKWI